MESRHGRRGRPRAAAQTRQLIRRLSHENPLWGAPRIHGELLKLDIDVGETSVNKYLGRTKTALPDLENIIKPIVSVDFFTAPTIRFQVLYVFLVLAYDRRGMFRTRRKPNEDQAQKFQTSRKNSDVSASRAH